MLGVSRAMKGYMCLALGIMSAVQNQEAASGVLAELSHIAAKGNAGAAAHGDPVSQILFCCVSRWWQLQHPLSLRAAAGAVL